MNLLQQHIDDAKIAWKHKFISDIPDQVKFYTPDWMMLKRKCICSSCGTENYYIIGSRCGFCKQVIFVLSESNYLTVEFLKQLNNERSRL